MTKVDPAWSLDALLRDYDPHPGWRSSFIEAYTKAIESTDPEERLSGWRIAAYIFGDMHAPVFCLFISYHGQSLLPPDARGFRGHIDLCLWELGLAIPTRPGEDGSIATADVGRPDGFHRDVEGTREWLAEQLLPFEGNMERAAKFAMRLTAIRFGLLVGPMEPSTALVLDESLWKRTREKPWWRFW